MSDGAPAEPAPAQQIIQIPVPIPVGEGGGTPLLDGIEELIPGIPGRGIALWHLFAILVLLLLGDVAVRRLRNSLPREGVLPVAVGILQVLVRVTIFFVVLGMPAVMASPSFAPMVLWVLLAAGAALGWSARDVLPDLLAGLVIVFERRVRRGMWIAGEGFAGIVASTGLRSTWLRDTHGHRVGIPNRRIIESPLLTDASGDTEQEVRVYIVSRRGAGDIRLALHDAVIASPWIFPDCRPVVLRDPAEPYVWRVRARLLEPRYAPQFEGELLERAEAILGYLDARDAAELEASTEGPEAPRG